jgi:hypothetical protein
LQIGSYIAKNRKLIREQFEKVIGGKRTEVTYEEARKVMGRVIEGIIGQAHVSDDKVKCVMRVGEVQGPSAGGPGSLVDYERVLEVYRKRHAGP